MRVLLTEAGLGLDNDTLRLERTTQKWVDAGARLRDELADLLANQVAGVEQVGSSSVVGLLAKPIIDIAIGLADEHDLLPVDEGLVGAEWIYRGDAGASGGHVFVLESKPGHRVAHAHVVGHQGEQWLNYLRLRNLLREDPTARGLARHVLTAGLDLLARAGARRVKICYEADNPASSRLYLSVGFQRDRHTLMYAGPTTKS